MRMFLSIAITALTVNAATIDWDCTNALGTSQNYCFYAQCRGGAGEGGQLASFYSTFSDEDTFEITIENWKGASYYEDNPTWTNDGGEFFLDPTGNFVDGKRSISGRGLKLDPGYSTPAAKLRTIKTEDGTEHPVIAEDSSNPLKAGDEIWSARRNAILKVVD
ncbi:hypothetical protein BDW67DRAFT_179902 [Aspergillus spinulosporus]